MATYPFVRLEEERRRLEADGVPVIDFGKGDPNEPTDERIRRALVESLGERSSYPLAQGLPELRRAVAAWCGRRFGVSLDPDREVIPTLGSKEAIFSLAQVLVDPRSEKRLVVYTEPGYPVYERGAEGLPPYGRHRAAGVRPARVDRRLGGRGARRARTRDLPAQAGAPGLGAHAPRLQDRREPSRHVPLGRGRLRRRRAAPPRARRRRLSGRVLRPLGRRVRALRARSDGGRVPSRGR